MAGEQTRVRESPDGDRLFEFLDQLRLAGFRIGIRDYITAHRVAAACEGKSGQTDPTRLRNWLAAVLCTNAEQQDEFRRRFRDWWNSLGPPEPCAPPPEPWRDTESEAIVRRSNRSKRTAIQSVILGALVLAVWIVYPSKDPAREDAPPIADETVAGRPAIAERAATPDSRISVLVVDSDGNPIRAATVFVAAVGSPENEWVSQETSNSGEVILPLEPTRGTSALHVSHVDYWPPNPYVVSEGPGRLSLDVVLTRRGNTWTRWLVRYQTKLQLVMMTLPLLLAGCWWRWKHARRALILERRTVRGNRERADVGLPEPPHRLYEGGAFLEARTEARRYRGTGFGDLDIEATVEQTVSHVGWYSPAYRSRLGLPAYLALVDRAGFRDQQARLVDEFLDRLVEGGVPVVRCSFDRDPRLVAVSSRTDTKQVSLRRLASANADHTLLMFSDGAGLSDPVTGRLASWTELFAFWNERALMTPTPAVHWGWREVDLSRAGFGVQPFSPQCLQLFLRSLQLSDGAYPTRAQWRPPFPEIFAERPARWLDRNELRPDELEELCRQLRAYLGEDGYRWLSSLAVYPALEWYLTLSLGLSLRRVDGSPALDEERLLRLTRLPWLRQGFMPDWLRLRRISGLDRDDEETVRVFLRKLLSAQVEPEGSRFRLELARPPDVKKRRSWKRFFVDLLRAEPADSPLLDYVFVTFLLEKKPQKLHLLAPRSWHRWVYERGLRTLVPWNRKS